MATRQQRKPPKDADSSMMPLAYTDGKLMRGDQIIEPADADAMHEQNKQALFSYYADKAHMARVGPEPTKKEFKK